MIIRPLNGAFLIVVAHVGSPLGVRGIQGRLAYPGAWAGWTR